MMAHASSSIRRLRRKFILMAVAALTITLSILCAAFIGIFAHTNTQRADDLIEVLHENGGAFPPPDETRAPASSPAFRVTPETPYETRYATAWIGADGNASSIDAGHIAPMEEDDIAEIAEQAWEDGKARGYLGSYRYAAFPDEDGAGTVIILDCYLQQQSMFTMLRIGLATSLACIAMVLLLLIPLSKRVVRPFERNLERQRRFVTDASHELKTPLSIISANTDLTERLSGETQWTRSTKTQIARLSTLVGDLVDTARASEGPVQGELPEVDLSLMAERAVEDFRPLAEASGKGLDARIEERTMVKGDERSLQRLLNILLDNAVKYCDEDGDVRVSLESRRRHAVLRVSNPAGKLSPDELPRIFDRFYRTDESRSRETGGYGIGLSAARGIVEGYGGKLVAKKDGADAVFTATLRRR